MFPLSRQLALAAITGFTLASLCSPVWAADGAIRNIQYDPATRHFVVDATGPVRAIVNTLTIAGHKRIIMDIDNAEIGLELPRDSQLLQGLSSKMPQLRNVTVNQYAGNGRPIVRILFDIDSDLKTIRLIRNQGPRLELEVNDTTMTAAQPRIQPTPQQRPQVTHDDNTVPREMYNRTLQALDEQKKQIQALQQEVARFSERGNTENQQDIAAQNAAAIAELRNTISQMNKRYEDLSRENQYLKSKAERIESQSATESAATKELQLELARLRQENRSLNSQLIAKPTMDNTLINAKQAEIDRLQRRVDSLQNDLQRAKAASNSGPSLDEMKRTLVTMNQKYDMLLAENQELKSDNMRLKSQTANSAGISDMDLQKLRLQLNAAQQSLNSSITTINEQNKEIAYLRNQVSDLKTSASSSSNAEINRMQETLDLREARIRSLEQQLASKNTSGGSASEVNALKKQLAQLTTQYQNDVESLNRQKKTREQQIDALEAALAEAKSKVSETQNATEELRKRDAQIADLQAELTKLRNAGSNNSQVAAQLREALTKLTRENQTLKTTLDDVKTQPKNMANETSLKNEIAKLTRENQELATALSAAQASLKNQPQPADNTAQIDQLKREIASLQTQAQQAKAESQKARQELEAQKKVMVAKPAANTGNSAALQKQLEEVNRQLASTRRENASLKEQIMNATASKRPAASSSSPSAIEAEQDYQQGKAAMTAGEIEKAIAHFKKAQLLEPDISRYVIDYSIALAEDQRYADAIETMRRYLQRNPGEREGYNQLGKLYLLNDQVEAATQAFSRAIPISTLNNYATTLKKLGKMEDAESVFKLALNLNPNDSEVLFNLGNLYNSLDKPELARNNYLQAIQIKPDFAEAHYNLGLIYAKLNDKQKAVNHLEKFLQLSPSARNAETIRSYVQKLKT